jgi:hypothetical protein
MKSLNYLVAIPTFIVLSLEGSSARSSIIHREDTATYDPAQHLQMTRDYLCNYYQDLALKFPKKPPNGTTPVNIEKKYNIELVAPAEAPLLLGLALMEGGIAPKADKWFVNFYDPYGESEHKNPKTGYSEDFRAELVVGLHHQWPEFILAMKVRSAIAKQPKDKIKRKVFAHGIQVRVRASVENLTQDFYDVPRHDMIGKQTTLSDPIVNPVLVALTTRTFAARKQLWQSKRTPLLRHMQARAQ